MKRMKRFMSFSLSFVVLLSMVILHHSIVYAADLTKPVQQTFTVDFYVDGVQVMDTQIVNYGEAAVEPAPDSYAKESRSYSDWNKTFNDVKENLIVCKTSVTKTCTVTFVDEDGITVLDTQTLDYGQKATYRGETPHKASTPTCVYTFSKWDTDCSCVTSDLIVKAVYIATVDVKEEVVPADKPFYLEKPIAISTYNVSDPKPKTKEVNLPQDKIPAAPVGPKENRASTHRELPKAGTAQERIYLLSGAGITVVGVCLVICMERTKSNSHDVR